MPFKEKDSAKEKGARWDKSEKKWYATADNFDALKQYAEGLQPASDLVEDSPPDETADAPTDPDLDEDVPF